MADAIVVVLFRYCSQHSLYLSDFTRCLFQFTSNASITLCPLGSLLGTSNQGVHILVVFFSSSSPLSFEKYVYNMGHFLSVPRLNGKTKLKEDGNSQSQSATMGQVS